MLVKETTRVASGQDVDPAHTRTILSSGVTSTEHRKRMCIGCAGLDDIPCGPQTALDVRAHVLGWLLELHLVDIHSHLVTRGDCPGAHPER